MYKRLKAYRAYIEGMLARPTQDVDWDDLIARHLVQVSFFQHERLIHLLVTLAFALMELAVALVTVLVPQPFSLALMALFLVLLVPYVVHYYHLENGTQALYKQYDQLVARAREAQGSCTDAVQT